jgi:hypothetical protein
VIQGRDARQPGDFPAVEPAQFRQRRQQDRLRPDADALDAFQKLLLFGKVLFQALVDVIVDLADLPIQHLDDGFDAVLDQPGRARQAMLFGNPDFAPLGAPRHPGQQGFLFFCGQTQEETLPRCDKESAPDRQDNERRWRPSWTDAPSPRRIGAPAGDG